MTLSSHRGLVDGVCWTSGLTNKAEETYPMPPGVRRITLAKSRGAESSFVPLAIHHFKTEWAKKYGHLNLGPGADNPKVESTKDFLDLLENFDLHGEDPTNRLRLAREMAYFAIYKVWGKSHPWAVKAEKEIMDALGLSYNGLLATGT